MERGDRHCIWCPYVSVNLQGHCLMSVTCAAPPQQLCWLRAWLAQQQSGPEHLQQLPLS